MDFIAKTMHGFESLLVKELESTGAKNIKPLRRAVSFSGDLEVLYRASYTCRTAIKILKSTFQFKAKDEKELYDRVKELPWEKHLDVDETFAIDSVVISERFKHSKYAALKMKDAIVDRFRQKAGRRPNIETENPDLQLHLHISDDKINISKDSSGESLHKRGYRSSGHASPLNEILAAGMIMLSGWTKEHQLMDPMCGSGTVPIEAAMIASNTPAGFLRQEYAFMKWRDFDEELWNKVKAEENSKIDKSEIRIKASDFSGLYVRLARTAATALGLDECIAFEKEDFFELDSDEGFVIMNPPYGERMTHNNIEDFYEEMADHLKRYFAGCQCWLISSNNEALLRFGLKPSKRITLFNGPFQCLFQKFELYKGSKKAKFQEGSIERAIKDFNEESAEDRPEPRVKRPSQGKDNRKERNAYSKPRKPREESEKTERPAVERQTKSGGLKWSRETPRDKKPFTKGRDSNRRNPTKSSENPQKD
ncbi:MAG: hypothetical protein HKN45_08835 [Flavobacteriales bacterium]|nr:hypothetical protein [Flavobacteriales bacterium]